MYIGSLANYQEKAGRTDPVSAGMEQTLNEQDNRLMNAALGLCGEAGEFADIVKKHYFQGHPLGEEEKLHLAKELGDVMWYIAEACKALGIGMDYVATTNIEKLLKRYPEKFSVEQSMNRKEGDI